MKKLMTFAAALAATGFLASAASATTIDFGAEAEFNGERGLISGSTLGPNAYIETTIQLFGWEGQHPYLDGPGGGEPTAGLGVCKMLDDDDQCDPSSDDNITLAEAVSILFLDGPFDVRMIEFLGEGHVDFNSNDTNTLLIGTNTGLPLVRYTFAGAVEAALNGAFLGLSSIQFYFDGDYFAGIYSIDANGLQANGDQYYIGLLSDVPLPGALPLLLSGLAGLGFAARRKQKAA